MDLNIAEFKSKCAEIFVQNSLDAPTDEQAEKLFALTERMLKVNESLNLTRITGPSAIILKHYADSLTISNLIPQGSRVIDVGCGAGFPSLPLAIFRPDIEILALDGTAKRIEYVKATAALLKLNNLTAIAARAEELAKTQEHRERYDVATARAVAALPILTELCLPYVKMGGKFIAMKAAQGENELDAALNSIKLCGGVLEGVTELELLSESKETDKRLLITIKKSAATPIKYPRHYSQISKKPL